MVSFNLYFEFKFYELDLMKNQYGIQIVLIDLTSGESKIGNRIK